MGNWRFKVAVLVVMSLLVLPSCGKREAQNSLVQALAMIPAGTGQFDFTDWTLIKQYEGAEGLTSRDSFEKRTTFLVSVFERQAVTNGLAAGASVTNARKWGWGSTDLRWEASALLDRGRLRVFKLREDFDLAPVEALFEERGFSVSEYRGVPIYSHQPPADGDWYVPTNREVFNTAIIAEDRLLVQSYRIDPIHKLLDVYKGGGPSMFDDESVQAVVSCLGGVAAAIVSTDMCAELADEYDFPPDVLEERHGLNPTQVHAYGVFALGYRYEGNQPVGLMVMQYARTEDAEVDLDVRSEVVQEGIGPDSVPYREVMTLQDASVQGNALVFQLRPVDDRPARLFYMVSNLNLIFAMCP